MTVLWHCTFPINCLKIFTGLFNDIVSLMTWINSLDNHLINLLLTGYWRSKFLFVYILCRWQCLYTDAPIIIVFMKFSDHKNLVIEIFITVDEMKQYFPKQPTVDNLRNVMVIIFISLKI